MKKILYIDSCINRTNSRTERLAGEYLKKRLASGDAELETIILEDAPLQALDEKRLAFRERCISEKDFSDKTGNIINLDAERDKASKKRINIIAITVNIETSVANIATIT